jgi:hypothetical protein
VLLGREGEFEPMNLSEILTGTGLSGIGDEELWDSVCLLLEFGSDTGGKDFSKMKAGLKEEEEEKLRRIFLDLFAGS